MFGANLQFYNHVLQNESFLQYGGLIIRSKTDELLDVAKKRAADLSSQINVLIKEISELGFKQGDDVATQAAKKMKMDFKNKILDDVKAAKLAADADVLRLESAAKNLDYYNYASQIPSGLNANSLRTPLNQLTGQAKNVVDETIEQVNDLGKQVSDLKKQFADRIKKSVGGNTAQLSDVWKKLDELDGFVRRVKYIGADTAQSTLDDLLMARKLLDNQLDDLIRYAGRNAPVDETTDAVRQMAKDNPEFAKAYDAYNLQKTLFNESLNNSMIKRGLSKESTDIILLGIGRRQKKYLTELIQKAKAGDTAAKDMLKPENFSKLGKKMDEIAVATRGMFFKRDGALDPDLLRRFKESSKDAFKANSKAVKNSLKQDPVFQRVKNFEVSVDDVKLAKDKSLELMRKEGDELKNAFDDMFNGIDDVVFDATKLDQLQIAGTMLQRLNSKLGRNGFDNMDEAMLYLSKLAKNGDEAAKTTMSYLKALRNNMDLEDFRKIKFENLGGSVLRSGQSMSSLTRALNNLEIKPAWFKTRTWGKRAAKIFAGLVVVGGLTGLIYFIIASNVQGDDSGDGGSDEENNDVSLKLPPYSDASDWAEEESNYIDFFDPSVIQAIQDAQACIQNGANIDLESFYSGDLSLQGLYDDMEAWDCDAISGGWYDDLDFLLDPPPDDEDQGFFDKMKTKMKDVMGDYWYIWLILIVLFVFILLGGLIYLAMSSESGESGSSQNTTQFTF